MVEPSLPQIEEKLKHVILLELEKAYQQQGYGFSSSCVNGVIK